MVEGYNELVEEDFKFIKGLNLKKYHFSKSYAFFYFENDFYKIISLEDLQILIQKDEYLINKNEIDLFRIDNVKETMRINLKDKN